MLSDERISKQLEATQLFIDHSELLGNTAEKRNMVEFQRLINGLSDAQLNDHISVRKEDISELATPARAKVSFQKIVEILGWEPSEAEDVCRQFESREGDLANAILGFEDTLRILEICGLSDETHSPPKSLSSPTHQPEPKPKPVAKTPPEDDADNGTFDAITASRDYSRVVELLDDEADKLNHKIKDSSRFQSSASEKAKFTIELKQCEDAKSVIEWAGLGSLKRIHEHLTRMRRSNEKLAKIPIDQRSKNAEFQLDKATDVVRAERNRVVDRLESKYDVDWEKCVRRNETLGSYDLEGTIEGADVVEYETLAGAVTILSDFASYSFVNRFKV